ncbi:MAG: hypothetical protein JF610_12180 [Acidobacteria bacterium]|nr:hypothetical protein [Acidobacteriota bacterium]
MLTARYGGIVHSPSGTGYDAVMAPIRSGQIVAFYLFDVAETIDLQALPALVAGPATAARLAPKPATPAYVQYDKPPISFDGSAVGIPDLDGFQLRFRAYDYGVISLALSKPFAGDWPERRSAATSSTGSRAPASASTRRCSPRITWSTSSTISPTRRRPSRWSPRTAG